MDYENKLVIGCANFGQEYNGYKVPDDEIPKIWDFCREVGIDMADTATAYKYNPPSDFKIINKLTFHQPTFSDYCYAVLVHNTGDLCNRTWWGYFKKLKEKKLTEKIGMSIYEPMAIKILCKLYPEIEVLQLPYEGFKVLDFLQEIPKIEIHVRKVFADDCYKEALADPNVDKVVIGIECVCVDACTLINYKGFSIILNNFVIIIAMCDKLATPVLIPRCK